MTLRFNVIKCLPLPLSIFILFLSAKLATGEQIEIDEDIPITLYGKIERHIFPGPPNYESVRKGDAPMRYWILKVNKLTTFKLGKSTHRINKGDEIQLVLPDNGYKTYSKLIGKNVRAKGSLFSSISGHHCTPLLLSVNAMSRMKIKD